MDQVADQVYRLGSKNHNFYLIVEDGEATVLDAGCSGEWKQLTGALETLNLGLDAVAGVLVTHVHADHIGLGKKAQDQGWSVSVHEDDESRALGTYTGRFSAKATELPLLSINTWRNMWPMIRAGVMSHDHLDVVDTYVDGDQLDLPGSPTAIHTPGHTEGHTVFVMESSGAVFTGDCLVTMDLLGTSRKPQPMSSVFSLDPAQNLESMGRIADLRGEVILPGHGEPWHGSPAEAVAVAKQAR